MNIDQIWRVTCERGLKTPLRRRIWFLGGVALALTMNFVALTGSHLFRDEANSFFIASCQSLKEIVFHLRYDGNAPLYPLVLHVWMNLFGQTEFVAQCLSILLGVGACAIMTFWVSDILDKKSGLVVLFLSSIYLPWLDYFIQVRPYALMLFSVSIILWCWNRILKNPSIGARWYLGLIFGNWILLYSHPWGTFSFGAMVLVSVLVAFFRQKIRATVFLGLWIAFVVIGLGYLPLFIIQWSQARESVAPFAGAADAENLMTTISVYTSPFQFLVRWFMVDISWLFIKQCKKEKTIYFWRWTDWKRERYERYGVPVGWMLILIVLAMIASQFVQCWTSRYALVVTPVVLLILTDYGVRMWRGLGGLPEKFARHGLVFCMLIDLVFLGFHFRGGLFPKTNMKNATDYIEAFWKPGDLVVISGFAFSPSLCFYLDRHIPVIAYPQGERVEITHWSGVAQKMEDPETLALFFERVRNQVKPGAMIWFVDPLKYSSVRWGIDKGMIPPPVNRSNRFLYFQFLRAGEIEKWLLQNNRRECVYWPQLPNGLRENVFVSGYRVEK